MQKTTDKTKGILHAGYINDRRLFLYRIFILLKAQTSAHTVSSGKRRKKRKALNSPGNTTSGSACCANASTLTSRPKWASMAASLFKYSIGVEADIAAAPAPGREGEEIEEEEAAEFNFVASFKE